MTLPRRISIALLFTSTLVTASASTYYIDYAPGMNGFEGSYSHTAGDRFVFKGGVTWPVSCFQMRIAAGGSSDSVRDRYESDQT